MKDNLIAILINVVSTGVVLIIALTWNKWIIPWVKSIVYKGIRINGTWTIEQSGTMVDGTQMAVQRHVDVILIQNANELKGNATARVISSENTKNQDVLYYQVKGEIRDRFVSLIFVPSEQSRILYSVFLLEVVSDGNLLKGYRTFYGHKKMAICALSCKFTKLRI